uniref:hypothetical protein n=1 Tax=uncultured Mitsuokella sp. TaxID=453120 RepID=UPI0026DBEB18
MNRKKAKQLRIMLAVMAVTGGYAFQNHAWAAEAFTGHPGDYTDFVEYQGEIIPPTGKSEYTFEKGASSLQLLSRLLIAPSQCLQ